MIYLPYKDDLRAPEADPKFRGEAWPAAEAAQARPRARARTRV